VRRRTSFSALRWISVGFIVAALVLSMYELAQYSRIRSNFPAGMVIAGIPVGNLDRTTAANQLLEAYSNAIELHYNSAVIQVKPSTAGFEMDLEGMLTAADMQRVSQQFWVGFWDFLWNKQVTTTEIPLRASLNEDRLRTYLQNEISSRYDEPPTAPIPIPGSTSFQAGKPGITLNIDRAVQLIDSALRSPTSRVVNLTFDNTNAPRASLQNLQVLIQQVIQTNGFDGIVDIYFEDLQTNDSLHFAVQNNTLLPVDPDIAFSAESSIKIPIMVSTLIRTDEPTPANIQNAMQLMIEKSGNNPADDLMDAVLTKGTGPLEVTYDMQTLGLQNTFLGAYMARPDFLQRFQTPANTRTDISTEPDPFSQTTPLDMGMLLEDIYMCSMNGGGGLAAAFPDKISMTECQSMISLLANNKTVAILLQAGLPDTVRIAHKHAYATEGDGYIHTMGDSGIIYTPGGNYIVSIFVHHPVQVIWDPVNKMVSEISEAIYNYFNTK
jgi:beta-lactamase class A